MIKDGKFDNMYTRTMRSIDKSETVIVKIKLNNRYKETRHEKLRDKDSFDNSYTIGIRDYDLIVS